MASQKIVCIIFLDFVFHACNKIEDLTRDPEITPLQQGFKASAAIGYCASLAAMVFEGRPVPENVVFERSSNNQYSGSGLIIVNVDEDHPLPFNDYKGQIIIGGLWDHTTGGGVISIVFGKFDLLSADFNFYGIHTIPVIKKRDSEDILTVFAEQDIVVGAGSDTIIHLGLSRIEFDMEQDRLGAEQPADMFVAVKQNVWFINIDQRNTFPNSYDDQYTINGGGQLLEASNASGGILYHALINTSYNYETCRENPLDGVAFIQNIKAGDRIDLGNIVLNFHPTCDGQAHVTFSTGKYLTANGRDVNLNFR